MKRFVPSLPACVTAVLLTAGVVGSRMEAQQSAGTEIWRPTQRVERMKNAKISSIDTIRPGDHGGNFAINVSCRDETMLIVSISPATRGATIPACSSISVKVGPDASIDWETLSVKTASTRNTPRSEHEPAETCSMGFIGDTSRALRQTMDTMTSATKAADPGAGAVVGIMGTLFGPLVAESGGALTNLAPLTRTSSMPAIFKAQEVLVELPLQDGTMSVVDFHPQLPAFRAFAATCVAPPGSAPQPPNAAQLGRLSGASDHFVFTASSTYDSRLYQGSPAGVAEALRKGILLHNLDPANYRGEINYITKLAQTCSTITPAMGAALTYDRPNSLGPQHKPCYGTTPVTALAGENATAGTTRGLTLMVKPIDSWGAGHGFGLRVDFKGSPEDAHSSYQGEQFVVYGVLDAVINGTRPASTASTIPGWLHPGGIVVAAKTIPDPTPSSLPSCAIPAGELVHVKNPIVVDPDGRIAIFMMKMHNIDLRTCSIERKVNVKDLMADDGIRHVVAAPIATTRNAPEPPAWMVDGVHAYTRKAIPDPSPNASGPCEVPAGSLVIIFHRPKISESQAVLWIGRNQERTGTGCSAQVSTDFQNLAPAR